MKMSRVESAIRIVLAFNEASNQQNVAAMMQLISDDCLLESDDPAPDGSVYAGKEAISQFWHTFFCKSPQANIQIEDIYGFGYRCVMRWRYEWVDAIGTKGHIRGVTLFQVKHGLICEMLSYVKG